MRFLVDECVDARLASALNAAGHDVVEMRIKEPGAGDDRVLAIAKAEHRVLLTADKDFGDLVVRQGKAAGVVLLRGTPGDLGATSARLQEMIAAHGERLHRAYVVVERDRVRLKHSTG